MSPAGVAGRAGLLLTALGEPSGGLLHRFPAALLETLMGLAGRGADLDALRAACGKTEIRNGYRVALASDHVDQVLVLYRVGRAKLQRLDREIRDLRRAPAELAGLLEAS